MVGKLGGSTCVDSRRRTPVGKISESSGSRKGDSFTAIEVESSPSTLET